VEKPLFIEIRELQAARFDADDLRRHLLRRKKDRLRRINTLCVTIHLGVQRGIRRLWRDHRRGLRRGGAEVGFALQCQRLARLRAKLIRRDFQSCIVGAALQTDTGSDDPAWQLADQALHEAREQARQVLAGDSRPAYRPCAFNHQGQYRSNGTSGRASVTVRKAARRHLRGDLLAFDLAAAHGARGPVQCVSVACVSGLVAMVHRAKLIQRGAADAVLVVGCGSFVRFCNGRVQRI
jgi:hypothetical protein